MRPFAIPSGLLLLGACRGEPAPSPPTAPLDVGSSPKREEAKTATSPAVDAASSTPSAKTSSSPAILPPPGMYAITMSDRSNTCPADAGAPDNAAQWVTMSPGEGGKWTANLPVNTGVGSPGMDRSQVVLEIGTTSTSQLQPDRTCNYQVHRDMKVAEMTSTKLVVGIHSTYTEAVGCTLPRRPVSCARDTVVTYTLTRAFCASRCLAKPTVLRDGGVEATCDCADAGPR